MCVITVFDQFLLARGISINAASLYCPNAVEAGGKDMAQFIDLSKMDSADLPCTLPTPSIPFFLISHYLRTALSAPGTSTELFTHTLRSWQRKHVIDKCLHIGGRELRGGHDASR